MALLFAKLFAKRNVGLGSAERIIVKLVRSCSVAEVGIQKTVKAIVVNRDQFGDFHSINAQGTTGEMLAYSAIEFKPAQLTASSTTAATAVGLT